MILQTEFSVYLSWNFLDWQLVLLTNHIFFSLLTDSAIVLYDFSDGSCMYHYPSEKNQWVHDYKQLFKNVVVFHVKLSREINIVQQFHIERHLRSPHGENWRKNY